MTRAALRLLAFAAPLAAGMAGAFAAPPPCDRYAAARVSGSVPPLLAELSGLVASRRHSGVFWAHNDSGHDPAVHAMRRDGTVVATFPLRGAPAADPEDIALGPCAPGAAATCLFLGDIGDNRGRRPEVAVLVVNEPATLRPAALSARRFVYRYPDGPRDAEALVVDPRTGRLYVIAKSFGGLGAVFRLDGLGAARIGRAVPVATLRLEGDFDVLATAADVHPRGDRLLLRTYGRVWEFRRPGAPTLESLFETVPTEVPGALQPQGEAIAYDGEGRSYLLGGEGAGSPLFHVECADEPAPGSS